MYQLEINVYYNHTQAILKKNEKFKIIYSKKLKHTIINLLVIITTATCSQNNKQNVKKMNFEKSTISFAFLKE